MDGHVTKSNALPYSGFQLHSKILFAARNGFSRMESWIAYMYQSANSFPVDLEMMLT